ncbi:MAG: hypothetical protein R2731_14380 [Nocardioides sp.]
MSGADRLGEGPTLGGVRPSVPRLLTSPPAWALAAAVVAALIGGGGGSRWYWTTPGLFLAYAVLWQRRRNAPPPRLPRAAARAAYVVAGLAAGVAYELGLSVDGTGVGGLNPHTTTSFLLLPGYLVPAVLLTLLAVVRYGLDAGQTFFVAAGMCWVEALTVGFGPMLANPWLAAPMLVFYAASYAVYTGAFGPLLVHPAACGPPGPERRPRAG